MPTIELTPARVEALQKILNLIQDEENAFTMGAVHWSSKTSYPKDSFEGACGTPACILGWAITLDPASLNEIREIDDDLGNHLCTPVYDDVSWRETPEYFTRAKTVNVLEHLMLTGRLNWTL